eukprot:362866-Chlamydomonas_euryale.AAC.25
MSSAVTTTTNSTSCADIATGPTISLHSYSDASIAPPRAAGCNESSGDAGDGTALLDRGETACTISATVGCDAFVEVSSAGGPGSGGAPYGCGCGGSPTAGRGGVGTSRARFSLHAWFVYMEENFSRLSKRQKLQQLKCYKYQCKLVREARRTHACMGETSALVHLATV